MKYTILAALLLLSIFSFAQEKQYPDPDFSNEIYYLKKDSGRLVRLDKGSASLDTKTKMGGFAGAESGYIIEGEKSTARFSGGQNLSFIYFTGLPAAGNPHADSTMRANGIDPSMMSNGLSSAMDPSHTITLYNMVKEKDSRKVVIQAAGGMKLMGKGKKASSKFTLSVRKVRDGYYELLVDKPLPKGEYAFTVMGMRSMDGSTTMFCFGID